MFRPNDGHLQVAMFNSIYNLPEKQLNQLEASWAGTFRREFFGRIDERPFAKIYSNEPSRPNYPVNVLVGLDTLKAGFGWSDEELYENFCFNLQVRYAVGCCDMQEGYFEMRTLYYHRQRVSRYMQETGENLYAQAFEQIADEQVAVYQLKTGKLRMDSTQIASNIREMSRLQLLVEVLQRAHRMLAKGDQEQYDEAFAPYVKGTSGQYVYRIRGEEVMDHLQPIGVLMARLVDELRAKYIDHPTYQMLMRVFREHFVVEEMNLRCRQGDELSASSLQSPDDWEATFRRKGDQGYKGYVANITETCDPENDFQLITKVQFEPNVTDDAAMMKEALPDLLKRTDVKQFHTDGGHGSPEVDEMMHEAQIEHVQTAIRGRKRAEHKLGLEDFDWDVDAIGEPRKVTCPQGQRIAIHPGRKEHHYLAYFDAVICSNCPFVDQCPTKPLKRKPERVLRFSQREVDLALRRKRCHEARQGGKNLRAAVESTMRSVKHPFRNGKLPVRGRTRGSMMVIGSAQMTNIRRIHRYEEMLREEQRKAKAMAKKTKEILEDALASFCAFLKVAFSRCQYSRKYHSLCLA